MASEGDKVGDAGRDATCGELTALIRRANGGDRDALHTMLGQCHHDLRRIARTYMRQRGWRIDEPATGVVNRVCEKLLQRERLAATDRKHFYRIFGRMLRDVIVDELRAEHSQKRGGRLERQDLPPEAAMPATEHTAAALIDLRAAMAELREHDAEAEEVVNLRYFCGHSLEQAATTLNSTVAIVRRNEEYGVAWLATRLKR